MINLNDKDLCNEIVAENKYRLNVLSKSNQLLLNEYIPYKGYMFDLANSLYKQISFSTNKIRRDFLQEVGLNRNADYHLSRSRVDRYIGYDSQVTYTKRLYNNMDLNESKSYIFATINYIHMTKFQPIDIILHNMKFLYRNFTYTNIFNKCTGLVIKHELAFNIYNGILTLTPHSHIIMELNNDLIDELKEDLYKHFKQVVQNPNNDIDIKIVNKTQKDYFNVARYVCKDFYLSIFHSKDNITIPYNHIVYLLLQTKNFRYINSYKNLYFKLNLK